MTNQNSTDFAELTVSFLADYLPLQRGLSGNTIRSYCDAFKLFLRFLVNDKSMDIKRFSLKDLDKNLVLEFLSSYRNKGVSPLTANQRLAAIKSFCEFASTESPECLNRLLAIRGIKFIQEVPGPPDPVPDRRADKVACQFAGREEQNWIKAQGYSQPALR